MGTDGIADRSRIAAENMLQGRHAALLGEPLPKRSLITLKKLTCTRAAQEYSAPQHGVDSEKIARVGRMTNLKCAAFQGCSCPGLQGFHDVRGKALHGSPGAGRFAGQFRTGSDTLATSPGHFTQAALPGHFAGLPCAGRFAGLLRTGHLPQLSPICGEPACKVPSGHHTHACAARPW